MDNNTSSADNGRSGRRRTRRNGVRFERNPSQVVFNPEDAAYVVTWAKCNLSREERVAKHKDRSKWRPSVSAMASLFDRGRIERENTVAAARAIGEAWRAGDRYLIDTDGAKRATELVADLSGMCVDPQSQDVIRDVRQALRHLVDEIALVRFISEPEANFEASKIIPSLDKAAGECLAISEFATWPTPSQRRRFLYCLNKHERSRVAYTLVSLLFDTGACPLLSLSDSRALRTVALAESGLEQDFSADGMGRFFRIALSKMQEAKQDPSIRLKDMLTQQQFSDCVAASQDSQ